MADVELDAPGLDLDAFRSLESNDFQAGKLESDERQIFRLRPAIGTITQIALIRFVRMSSTKPEACHHLPVVTGKVELRPVPGRKRPHEDVEVVEVWMVALFF